MPTGVGAEYPGISGCMHRCDSTSVMTESRSSAEQKVRFPLLSVSSFMGSALIGNLAGLFSSVFLGGKSLMRGTDGGTLGVADGVSMWVLSSSLSGARCCVLSGAF